MGFLPGVIISVFIEFTDLHKRVTQFGTFDVLCLHACRITQSCSLCRFWPVNCIFWPIETLDWLFRLYSDQLILVKVGEHVAVLSDPTVHSLYCIL